MAGDSVASDIETGFVLMSKDRDDRRDDLVAGLRNPKRVWSQAARTWCMNNLLLLLTIGGIVAGFILGLSLREAKPSSTALTWIALPGDVFMSMLRMLVLPLIICSVISGMATINPRSNGKISLVALTFIVLTNIIGSLLGVIFSFVIRREEVQDRGTSDRKSTNMNPSDIFSDLIRNIFPDNIVAATFSQVQTQYSRKLVNATNGTENEVTEKSLAIVRSANLLGLMVFCIVIAIATNRSGDKGKPFLVFFSSATDIFLITLRWLIWYTPIGVCSLIAATLAAIDDVGETFASVGYLVVGVTCGVACHELIVMPVVLFLFIRKNPFLILLSLSRAWLVGFATTSTAIAIPEMFEAVEVRNNVDKRVSRFAIPFSVTLSANGSAIFISAGAIFLASVSDWPLDYVDYIVILVLTAISALSIPSVPSSSIVTLLIIVASVNIPDHHVGLLFAVEWFLDRIRTTANVVSHSSCAIVTYRMCKRDLQVLDAVCLGDVSSCENEVLHELPATNQTP